MVEVGVDEEGKYNLVRMEQRDLQSKLPARVTAAATPAIQFVDQQLAAIDGSGASAASGCQTELVGLPESALRRAQDNPKLRMIAQSAVAAGTEAALEAGPLLPPESIILAGQTSSPTQ